MFLIILNHLSAWGKMTFEQNLLNGCIADIFKIWGGIGDNIFILITGYFSINYKLKFEKIFRLYFELTLYSIVLYIIACSIGICVYSKKGIFQAVFPFISGGGYWFIVHYLILMFILPIITVGANNLSLKQFKIIITFFTFIFVFVLQVLQKIITTNNMGYNNLMWMIFLCLCGMFIHKYVVIRGKYNIMLYLALLIFIILIFAAKIFLFYENSKMIIINDRILKILISICAGHKLNSPLIFGISICIFLIFKNIEVPSSRFIFIPASTVLGIYLLHDNKLFREYMWQNIFHTNLLQNTRYFLFYSILIVCSVFIICMFIELIRKKIENFVFGLKPVKSLTMCLNDLYY